jgi:hypothetical protein
LAFLVAAILLPPPRTLATEDSSIGGVPNVAPPVSRFVHLLDMGKILY